MNDEPHESKIEMSLVVNSPNHAIDMSHGARTFIGVSDLITRLADAAFNNDLVENRQTSNPIRTDLQTNFASSYGQNFVLRIKGEELIKRANEVGKKTFCEIVDYYVKESLYMETPELSQKAKGIIDGISEIHEDLLAHIRNPLKNMHKITEAYGYGVVLKHRIEGGSTEIIKLDQETATRLKPVKLGNESFEFEVVITRFNHLTGNGRLIIKGGSETVAFGFSSGIKLVKVQIKKSISNNLSENTALKQEDWKYIKITAKKLTLRNKKIVKLLVSGIVDEQ